MYIKTKVKLNPDSLIAQRTVNLKSLHIRSTPETCTGKIVSNDFHNKFYISVLTWSISFKLLKPIQQLVNTGSGGDGNTTWPR